MDTLHTACYHNQWEDRCGVLQGDKIQWIDTTSSSMFSTYLCQVIGAGGVDNILNEIVTQFEIPNIPLPCLMSGFPADGLNN